VREISVAEAKRFDKFAQEKLGVPSIILMENAGRSVASEAIKMGCQKVAVVCGVGNNGGDGLVAARHLLNAGKKVSIYLVGKTSKLKTDSQINFNILLGMKQKIINCEETEKFILRFPSLLAKADLVIDAIFGIGLISDVRKPYSEIIAFLNRSGKPILSVDVPSGLDGDTGKILGVAIKAQKTVTFVAPKIGFSKADGPKCCGEIIIKDIGVIYG